MNPDELKQTIDGLKYIESLRVSNYYLLTYSIGATGVIIFLVRYIVKTVGERFKDLTSKVATLETENTLLKQMNK
jgi:hypothetical protein